jgi:hypothetical protein
MASVTRQSAFISRSSHYRFCSVNIHGNRASIQKINFSQQKRVPGGENCAKDSAMPGRNADSAIDKFGLHVVTLTHCPSLILQFSSANNIEHCAKRGGHQIHNPTLGGKHIFQINVADQNKSTDF